MKNRARQTTDRDYEKLVVKLVGELAAMEMIGEQDMGLLAYRYAARYHRITAELRDLISLLSEDVAWPFEPIKCSVE